MPRIRKKEVKTFAINIDTLAELREVAAESGVSGGMSAIVENAVSSWLRRYTMDPKGWLSARGMAVPTDPDNDDI